MPRPPKSRWCRAFDGERVYKPLRVTMRDLEVLPLELGELEAMRLCDLARHQSAPGRLADGCLAGAVQRLLKG